MIALWVLVGFQAMQLVAIAVWIRLDYLRNEERKRIDIVNAELTVKIVELPGKRTPTDIRFPWALYEPGSINHPASYKPVDQYATARGAVLAAQRKFRGVPIQVTDGYFDSISPLEILSSERIEAS